MYTAHFGLREAPFAITPDPRYLYLSERHREALAHLLYGVGEGGGFVQLTGEVGTGKTTVCRCVLEQLPPHVDVALVLNPRLTSAELLATVCDELGVTYPPGTTSLKTLVDALDRHLLDAHARGRRTVLVIDEAQDLAEDVLEQVRLLTNLETTTAKLLQIILIGQPELGRLLEEPRFRQLAQRITARYHLTPLAAGETRAYVRHRLAVAGRREAIFGEAAVRAVHRLSGGVPRLINVICDRALLGAYTRSAARVDAPTVRRAAAEVLGRPVRTRRALLGAAAGVAAAVVAVALAGPERLVRPGRGPAVAARTAPSAADPGPAAIAVDPSPREAVLAPRTGPALADLLADPAAADRSTALAAVYRRWRPAEPGPPPGATCEAGRIGTLGCQGGTGTWRKLRRLNVPVVIELVGAGGARHHAAVTSLDDDRATLELGGASHAFLLAEIDRHWEGGFWLLWPRPGLPAFPLGPGSRGPDVAWLRRRLDVVEGRVPGAGGDVYDETLRQRVVAFQRSRGLVADGLAGLDTVTQLAIAAQEPGVPWLAPAGTDQP